MRGELVTPYKALQSANEIPKSDHLARQCLEGEDDAASDFAPSPLLRRRQLNLFASKRRSGSA